MHYYLWMVLLSAYAFSGCDLLEDLDECTCVDLFVLADGYCSSGFVIVPARDDAPTIRDYAPIV